MTMTLDELRGLTDAIRAEVGKAVIGQQDTLDHLLIALVSHGHVLLEGRQQVFERRQRQGKGADLSGQRGEHLRPAAVGLHPARSGRMQVAAIAGQRGQALGGAGIALIGQVVGGAGEVVDGRNGRAQARRAQPGGDRKILVMVDRGAWGQAQGACCSRKRCASSAAMQPVPALVMAWRYTWSCTSPAANTPGTLVCVAMPCRPPWVRM